MENKGINVLSLFDGMSCGQIALEKAGIKVNKYFASEVDKHAIKVTQSNYPNTVQLGSVEFVTAETLRNYKIDLLIGGSPCQGFSFAGKQLNFDDPRSKLFFDYVRLLRDLKPKYFLLENVKMKKESQDIISKYLGVEPIEINSSLVSAQNRRRLYWTNIPGVEQPEDKNKTLVDIIESGVTDREKSFYLDANYYKGGNLKSYFEKNRRQLIFELGKINKRVKGITITNEGVRPHKNDKRKSGVSELGRLFFKDAKKSYTLISSHSLKIIFKDGYRKLTPIECERLQTVPDNYTASVSNTQRYKMLGNGWTVDVITHIFKNIRTKLG